VMSLGLPAAAVAGVLFLLVPAVWGWRVWLAVAVLAVAWHLGGQSNDTGQALTPGPLSGFLLIPALGALVGGAVGIALRAARQPGTLPSRKAIHIGEALLAFVAVLPIGPFVIAAASLALAGSAHPAAWHIGFLTAAAVVGGLACWRGKPVLRGLALGVAVSCAWATIDSLRLEATLRAYLSTTYFEPGAQACLGTGPQGRALTHQRPLMTLTAERPLMLRTTGEPLMASRYWFFGDRTFATTSPPPPLPTCVPSSGPLLPE